MILFENDACAGDFQLWVVCMPFYKEYIQIYFNTIYIIYIYIYIYIYKDSYFTKVIIRMVKKNKENYSISQGLPSNTIIKDE